MNTRRDSFLAFNKCMHGDIHTCYIHVLHIYTCNYTLRPPFNSKRMHTCMHRTHDTSMHEIDTFTDFYVYMCICVYAYIIHLRFFMCVCVHAYMHYTHVALCSDCITTCNDTHTEYKYAYIHAYMPTRAHACIHIYIHGFTRTKYTHT